MASTLSKNYWKRLGLETTEQIQNYQKEKRKQKWNKWYSQNKLNLKYLEKRREYDRIRHSKNNLVWKEIRNEQLREKRKNDPIYRKNVVSDKKGGKKNIQNTHKEKWNCNE